MRVLSESQLVDGKVVVGAGSADVLVRIERAARTVSTIRPVYSVNYVAGLYPLCKPDIVYVLDRGHRLHFWALTMPVFNWGNAFVSFIEYTE